MEIQKLNNNNIEEIRSIYNSFVNKATEDYLFEISPLNFDNFKDNFLNGFIKGYYSKDINSNGFLLYSDMLNQAIEITIIHTENTNQSFEIKKALLEKFLFDIKQIFNNKTISYPMLGIQNDFKDEITKLGFTPVSEMIVELNFENLTNDLELTQLAENYKILPWNDVYLQDIVKIIQEEFSKLNDVKFDPRFKTIDGTKSIINEIVKSYYGDFDPRYTSVLFDRDKLAGCCFVNFTTHEIANIPIIALAKEYKNQGLGSRLLQHAINLLKNDITSNKISAKWLNATCDADNLPAVKAYLKTGFKKTAYYTHACKEI